MLTSRFAKEIETFSLVATAHFINQMFNLAIGGKFPYKVWKVRYSTWGNFVFLIVHCMCMTSFKPKVAKDVGLGYIDGVYGFGVCIGENVMIYRHATYNEAFIVRK